MSIKACDYKSIREENKVKYGTDIGRIGPRLLAERYADRTHFIFELLQNAEDALARRQNWIGERSVSFELSDGALHFTHFGKPFDEADVIGICGIDESTKDLTDIGRFGIGFKSVYAFTDSPEVHSGVDDFAIESFVWPRAAKPIARDRDETVIILPLRGVDEKARAEITSGLQKLGPSSLLFLRQIEGIKWIVKDGPSGQYLREEKKMEDWIRQVTVIGQSSGERGVDETWLLFTYPAEINAGRFVGNIEIAFRLTRDKVSGKERVRRIDRSPLVAFFPTELETHLGFLVQGPYRTTPSRDNVPRTDTWNQHLASETSLLLVKILPWLRDHDMLETSALLCLPLDPTKFPEDTMFNPLFEATKRALLDEALLPSHDRGNVKAGAARLADSQGLRELFSASQLAKLYESDSELAWLSGDITRDRVPELRQYLMSQLDIDELNPEKIIQRLNKTFLEAQSDEWILQLYEFLNGQPAMRRRLSVLPLIRIENGTHIVPKVNGQAQAFLPGELRTGFPTVHPAVCATETAVEFLRSLGLTEPNLVDDIILNVLPRYEGDEADVANGDYEADIARILKAFAVDSKEQHERLLASLRVVPFIKAVNLGNGSVCMAKPIQVYLATERLRQLFDEVNDILTVNASYSCLRGEDIREMLEACGAYRHIKPIEDNSLSYEQRAQYRRSGNRDRSEGFSRETIVDWTLMGLDELLLQMARLEGPEQRRQKAQALWEELAALEERRGKGVFSGEYSWTHYGDHRSPDFDSAFIRRLNSSCWVPDETGSIQSSQLIVFDTLGWNPNPFLQSKIRFKPPILNQLAAEAGIEPGLIDLLKTLGVTSAAGLRERLGIRDETPINGQPATPNGSGGGAKPDGANGGTGEGGGRGAASHPPLPRAVPAQVALKDERQPYQVITSGYEPPPPRQARGDRQGEREEDSPDLNQSDRDKIEAVSRRYVRRVLVETMNYSDSEVTDEAPQNEGYDITVKRGEIILLIEIKGHKGRASMIELTSAQYSFYLRNSSNPGRERWELWNVENLGAEAKDNVLIRRFCKIPQDALQADRFRLNLRKCTTVQDYIRGRIK